MANSIWKAGIPASQPIIALEREPGEWIIFGGTYQLKKFLDNKGSQIFDQEFPAPLDFHYMSHIYHGERPTTNMMKYIDYVMPLVPNQEEQKEQKLPPLRRWKNKPEESKYFYTMYYEEPVAVPDFIPPSYWDEFLFYLRFPQVYPAIALVGPTGNGKTTAAIKAMEALNASYLVIDMTEFTVPEDLIGSYTYHPEHGRIWVDGQITHAFRHGMNVIINEFDAANPRAVLSMQSALQDPGNNSMGRYVTVANGDEDRVYPQGPCTIVITMNTYGTGATRQYVGRNAADQATMDRFAFISTIYENEELILMSRGYKKKTATEVMKWAVSKRKAIDENALRLNISPRTLMRVAHLIENLGMSLKEAVERQFLNRVPQEDRELLS